MTLTDAEKSMCWHAARGLETGLTVDDVNTVLAKIGMLEADLQAERDRADRLAVQVAELRGAVQLHLDAARGRYGNIVHATADTESGLLDILAADPDARGQAILDRLAHLEAAIRAVLDAASGPQIDGDNYPGDPRPRMLVPMGVFGRLAHLEAGVRAALSDLDRRDELSATDRLRALAGEG